MNSLRLIWAVSCLAFVPLCEASAQGPGPVRDLNTPREFPAVDSAEEWRARAGEIREHVLFSCGLYPMPEKTPLQARVFDRMERDGYSIEKVYFQSYPGFYVAGNLYRPIGKGSGPFPAVLNPHGHWKEGRLADTETGSIAARCISFARQGMIAFSYDMVGYNDTAQVSHQFASAPTNLLWNISLMGLQTWNSIRALDFLESLPDVDRNRLACTGESGGGTQTFMLGAIDDRLAAQAPVVMVSHSMQGGCLCENAPGLRVDYSNMEIAAAAAPRPQLLVAATGDWTKTTMSVEGPAIEHVYEMLGAEDGFDYQIFDFGHNYNQTSREAVYAFFGRWLLGNSGSAHLEQPYTKEADADLRVFPNGDLPDDALNEQEFIQSLVKMYEAQLDQLHPRDARGLARWKEKMRPAWEHAFQVQHVAASVEKGSGPDVRLVRQPDGAKVNLKIIEPEGESRNLIALMEDPEGLDLVGKLRKRGVCSVLIEAPAESAAPTEDQFGKYFSTYNRTVAQDRVASFKCAADYLKERYPEAKIVLIGSGLSGPAVLMAAPVFSGVVAGMEGVNGLSDLALTGREVFVPGIRRLGGFNGILAIAAPNPIFLHGSKEKLGLNWLEPFYGRGGSFVEKREPATKEEIAEWISSEFLSKGGRAAEQK